MPKPKRRCSEAFTVQGVWWEPTAPSVQVAGTLMWSPFSGGELTLVGGFQGASQTNENWRIDILHGVAEGAEFTLLDCNASSTNIASPGVLTQQIAVLGGVLVGAMIPDITKPIFDRMTIEIDHLGELSGRPTPRAEYQRSDGVRITGASINYEHPPDVVAVMPHETVRLASEFDISVSAAPRRGQISERVVIAVDLNSPVPLEDMLSKYVTKLRDLVTFASQIPAVIRSVQAAGPVTAKRPLQVLKPFLPTPRDPADSKLLTEELFKLPNDNVEFRALIQGWLDLADQLGPVIGLRFAAGYVPFVYAETRFLNAAQAVEALHRRALASDPDPGGLEAREAAIAACPPQYQSWLRDELRYSHEPSLRQRLREVLDFVGPIADAMVGERGRFIQKVVSIRNAITHWDVNSAPVSGAELYRLAVKLNFTFDAVLLRCLGFESSDIEAKFANRRSI